MGGYMWGRHVCAEIQAVLQKPDFFLLRTALKDSLRGPPAANRQLMPTTNHQPLK